MATATTTTTTSSTPELRLCDSKTSATTASMDEAPPQSMLSLSTEASSQINRNNHVNVNMNFNDESTTSDHVVDSPQRSRPVRRNSNGKNNNNHCDLVDDDDQFQGGASSNCCGSAEVRPSLFQQMEDVPRVYMEKLYENTVDGPCQGITMCEVDHLDFFTNCHQPLSFLGFGGHHPGDARYSVDPTAVSYHNIDIIDEDLEPMPLPGAYAVPVGCEYCGVPNTNQCCPTTCPRPKLFFQKKRPPFAPRDASLWNPVNDYAVTTTTTNNNNCNGSDNKTSGDSALQPTQAQVTTR